MLKIGVDRINLGEAEGMGLLRYNFNGSIRKKSIIMINKGCRRIEKLWNLKQKRGILKKWRLLENGIAGQIKIKSGKKRFEVEGVIFF